MRKINFFLILLAVLGVSSCSENEVPNIEESTEQVNVSFLTQPDITVTAGSRAIAENLTDAKKFCFYAFKKKGETYSFAKEISDDEAAYGENKWTSSKSLLAVGTYRFLCLYNVGDRQTLASLDGLQNKSWSEILNGIIFEQKSKTDDVDEFFSGESKNKDVQITGTSGNSIVVEFAALTRVVSRIDVKFVKLATDDKTEVQYSGTNSIFGAEGNLVHIKQTVFGLANKFSLGKTDIKNYWDEPCEFLFNPLNDLVTLGTSGVNSTFPKDDEKDMNDTEVMKGRIIKGGAYFRGAYVLPFMDDAKTLTQVKLYLEGKPAADNEMVSREIEAPQAGAENTLFVKKNFITLITVKLKSSTAPKDASTGGKDEEHLFNPKVSFTVTVDSQYAGVNNSDVVVE